DHQHGCVLAGSVNLDVIAAACRTEDNIVRIKSEGYDMDVVDLSDLSPNEKEHGKAVALIRGMLAIMRDRGYDIGGFNAYTTSNVLKGSGLSSSAAFEVLVGAIISGIFNNNTISPVEIAKIAQKSENIYFGKPCGLMDQMASAVGGFTAIDFNDPQNPVIEKVDFDLSSKDYSLCIINTGGNHADLTGDYTAITAECRAVAEFFGKSVLRDVDETEFYSKIAEMRLKLGDRAILRAIHFINDNKKAVLEKNALKNGDVDEFLRLVTASGNSSFKYLQNVFSSSIPEEQGLSLALAVSERILGGRGAHRVHGGGFAGTIQAFVPNDLKAVYLKEMGSIFGSEACYVLNIRPIGCAEIK
ncbi:MAG: galactokinase, partial [Oscillospiraceae bacterium]